MSITIRTAARRGPEINMSTGNAAQLMQLLGYDEEAMWNCEPVTGEDLLGRVLLAHALLDVATDDERGRPAVTGRWTEWGTEPGYLAGRLAELADLASWAATNGHKVVWG